MLFGHTQNCACSFKINRTRIGNSPKLRKMFHCCTVFSSENIQWPFCNLALVCKLEQVTYPKCICSKENYTSSSTWLLQALVCASHVLPSYSYEMWDKRPIFWKWIYWDILKIPYGHLKTIVFVLKVFSKILKPSGWTNIPSVCTEKIIFATEFTM